MYKEEQQQRRGAWEVTVRKAQLSGRRRGLLFYPMSVAPADDYQLETLAADEEAKEEGTPSSEEEEEEQEQGGEDRREKLGSCQEERLLPSGDFYTGEWCDGAPQGTGKYLWTDGCMYEGEWRSGKTTGRGKFSWPSGATYEGEFRSGFMDGFGTYTGSNGDTYRGAWSMNLKHGRGRKSYVNGDYYDGEWRCGVQEGRGRYVWRNGNEYSGEWHAGVIHGAGTLVWANGNRFDGGWESGAPRGKGTFLWADGSLYIGVWSAGGEAMHQKGVYYPSPGSISTVARDPHEAFATGLGDCKVCPGETVSILPSQKSLNWPGVEAEFLQKQALWRSSKSSDSMAAAANAESGFQTRRRASVDNSSSSGAATPQRRKSGSRTGIVINSGKSFDLIYSWDSEDIGCEDRETAGEDTEPLTARSPLPQVVWPPKEVKKQGETISKGQKNYELMLNLQLGIRHAVGKQPSPNMSFDLKVSAFDPKEKVWTKFPPEGSKQTPPHNSCEFKWKDYCPVVFRTLRQIFKVDAGDYMLSICGNDALRELSSPGKSGSFFYLTNDDRYMIKTMKKSEVKVLLRMLQAYYNHVRAFENTLVAKFFGLHCVKLTGATQRKVRFVIMGNLFCSEYPIHRRFDLKGSSHGRTTDKPDAQIDANTTLKDLDLNYIFRLQKSSFQDFRRQVDRDCELLEQERIMDYSLLVGLHFCNASLPGEIPIFEGDNEEDRFHPDATPNLSRDGMDHFLSDITRLYASKLGSNMPSRVERTVRQSEFELVGEPTGEFHDVILYFGIIDILQDYDISKKLEHAYKSIQYDPTSISAVDPKWYSKRFRDFIYAVFTEDS